MQNRIVTADSPINTNVAEAKPSDNIGRIAESPTQGATPDPTPVNNTPAESGQQMATTSPDASTDKAQFIYKGESTGQDNVGQVGVDPEVSKYAGIIQKKMEAEKKANLDQYKAVQDILNQPDGKELAQKVVARFHNSEEVASIIKIASKAGLEWLVQHGFAIADYCIGKLEKRHQGLDASDLTDAIKKQFEVASEGNTFIAPDDHKAIIDAAIFSEKVRANELILDYENILEAFKRKIRLTMTVLKALQEEGVDLNQSVKNKIQKADMSAA